MLATHLKKTVYIDVIMHPSALSWLPPEGTAP